MIKPIVGAGSQYMSAAKDKNGEWLDGGKTYSLHVPANVPAKEFWAVTVYDVLTRSMIATDTMKAGVSSKDTLKTNADGSVDVQFGPQAPKDGGNRVKTIPGRGWLPTSAGMGRPRRSSTELDFTRHRIAPIAPETSEPMPARSAGANVGNWPTTWLERRSDMSVIGG